jgi:hypothetical protein
LYKCAYMENVWKYYAGTSMCDYGTFIQIFSYLKL